MDQARRHAFHPDCLRQRVLCRENLPDRPGIGRAKIRRAVEMGSTVTIRGKRAASMVHKTAWLIGSPGWKDDILPEIGQVRRDQHASFTRGSRIKASWTSSCHKLLVRLVEAAIDQRLRCGVGRRGQISPSESDAARFRRRECQDGWPEPKLVADLPQRRAAARFSCQHGATAIPESCRAAWQAVAKSAGSSAWMR